jgi:AcrR family transcriptional regulator
MGSDLELSHDWMRMKELAEKAGVSRHTIHYYYREGLLPPPLKTGRTMALYTDAHLECLRFIRKLRDERNIPVAAVRQEVRLRFGEYWRSTPTRFVVDGVDSKPHPRGRKQRQRIIEAAMELFSSQGYHRTNVSHVTGTLRISKETFYLHFKNKHDLLVAVFDHLVQKLTQLEQDITGETDYFVRSRKRGEAFVTFYRKYHKIFDIIRAESIGPESGSELSVQAIYRKILDPVTKDFAKAQEEGLIRKTSGGPELLSYMVLGALEFLCYHLLVEGKYSMDEIFDALVSALLVGPENG